MRSRLVLIAMSAAPQTNLDTKSRYNLQFYSPTNSPIVHLISLLSYQIHHDKLISPSAGLLDPVKRSQSLVYTFRTSLALFNMTPLFRVVEDHERARKEHESLAKERIAKDRAMEKDHLRIEKLQQNARANKELMEKMKENIHS